MYIVYVKFFSFENSKTIFYPVIDNWKQKNPTLYLYIVQDLWRLLCMEIHNMEIHAWSHMEGQAKRMSLQKLLDITLPKKLNNWKVEGGGRRRRFANSVLKHILHHTKLTE